MKLSFSFPCSESLNLFFSQVHHQLAGGEHPVLSAVPAPGDAGPGGGGQHGCPVCAEHDSVPHDCLPVHDVHPGHSSGPVPGYPTCPALPPPHDKDQVLPGPVHCLGHVLPHHFLHRLRALHHDVGLLC